MTESKLFEIISHNMTNPKEFVSGEDKKLYRHDHDADSAFVDHLVELGIRADDLGDILEIRNSMSGSYISEYRGKPKLKVDAPSGESIVTAYSAVQGDVDLFRQLADFAHYIEDESEEEYDRDVLRGAVGRKGSATRRLYAATEMYKNSGPRIFEGDFLSQLDFENYESSQPDFDTLRVIESETLDQD